MPLTTTPSNVPKTAPTLETSYQETTPSKPQVMATAESSSSLSKGAPAVCPFQKTKLPCRSSLNSSSLTRLVPQGSE